MSRRIVHTYGRKARAALVDSTTTPVAAQCDDAFPPAQGPQASPAETEHEAKARSHNQLVRALTEIGRSGSPSNRRGRRRSLFRKAVVFDERSIDDDDDEGNDDVRSASAAAAAASAKGAHEQHDDDVVTTHCDFSTTQSALELVESGNTQAKLDNLLYIIEGFDSGSASVLVASAKLLAQACSDRGNRCVVRALRFAQVASVTVWSRMFFPSMDWFTPAFVLVLILAHIVKARPPKADAGATKSVFEARAGLNAHFISSHPCRCIIIAARGSGHCILFVSMHRAP